MIDLDDDQLVLAAEEYERSRFEEVHRFSRTDERAISKLMAHGPVLLQGGRGTGKSALMLEAARRLSASGSSAYGVYVSLRHLPLLRAHGEGYETTLCELIIREITESLRMAGALPGADSRFAPNPHAADLQVEISRLAARLNRRIVLFFDDAAHIGREASLAGFFDIFRLLSSSTVSCKATIYPGVTQFGTRFDIYNDATIVDVQRNEEQADFERLFADVATARFPALVSLGYKPPLTFERVASFLGRAVLGNMRGYVFACNALLEHAAGDAVGVTALGDTLVKLSSDYYWPLLDEVEPKLGKYIAMVEPARSLADELFKENRGRKSCLVHREIVTRLSKPFEILEYVGFISKREASRAMKSGGRGTRYALNLCNLLEQTHGTRLTADIFERWNERDEPAEYHSRGSKLLSIDVPPLGAATDLQVLALPIDRLAKSQAYPYGLSQQKIKLLTGAGFDTISKLADASEAELCELETVGKAIARKLKAIVEQAVWM